MSLPRNATFYKTKVSATVDTALDNAFAEFSVRYHIEGLRFFGFEFVHTTRKWNGLVFTNNEGVGTGGLSGGSMFIGFTGAYLNSLIRFKVGAYNYFVNATTFQACRDSYSNYQILFEITAWELVFSNISSQENLLGTIFSTDAGGIRRSLFDFVHNWDNNISAIRLSKNSVGNSLRDVYPYKFVDYGYGNSLSPIAQTLKTSSVGSWRDETCVKRMKSDFARAFNITNVTGTATITDGMTTGAEGTLTPSVNLKCLAANDVALLFSQTDEGYTAGWGIHHRYSKTMLEVEFRLNQTDIDDYSLMIGIVGSTAKLGTVNAFAQGLYLTNVGGNFVIVQHLGYTASLPSTGFTTLYTLGAINTKMHSVGLQINNYQSGSDLSQVFHFDEVAVGSFSGTNSGNRSPVIAARSTTGKTITLSIKSTTLKHIYNQSWL